MALDGTKIKANASKHKGMSYARMEDRAAEPEAEVAGWLRAAEAADAIDGTAQVIVAQDVMQSPVDSSQLVPMIDATKTNLGRYPEQASAGAGYCSEANLEALENRDIDGYVATGRARDAVR